MGATLTQIFRSAPRQAGYRKGCGKGYSSGCRNGCYSGSGLHLKGLSTPGQGQGEGSAGDKFRVSGTQETVEGAEANEVSGVLSEATAAVAMLSSQKKEIDSKVGCFASILMKNADFDSNGTCFASILRDVDAETLASILRSSEGKKPKRLTKKVATATAS